MTGKLRALLVDDEQPARERLKQLLASHADVEVVGEAEDGLQAAELIAERQPDVVFLDIQMPGASGLDVAASLGGRRPLVIFCTAFDQYAVDAFELSAADYLLKPVNRARLAAALDRVRAATGEPPFGRSLAAATRSAGLSPTRVLARRGNRFKVVPMADVVAFTFTDGVTRVVTATETLTMQPTLAALGRRLDPSRFCQVSRTVVVQLDAVREARPFADGAGEIVLANGQTVPVTRRRWRGLVEKLEGL
jgi:two-component system LytT family response regulator